MPTPNAYNRLLDEYEKLRLASIRVCVSDHPAQGADPAPELALLWDLVGDFTDTDLQSAEQIAFEAVYGHPQGLADRLTCQTGGDPV